MVPQECSSPGDEFETSDPTHITAGLSPFVSGIFSGEAKYYLNFARNLPLRTYPGNFSDLKGRCSNQGVTQLAVRIA